MNNYQEKFFQYLALIQENSVENTMCSFKCEDEKIRSMLYDTTYNVITDIMEMLDGYSSFSEHKLDIIDKETKVGLKENPFIELHDQTEEYLRYE